jgi:hypothetical protein
MVVHMAFANVAAIQTAAHTTRHAAAARTAPTEGPLAPHPVR